MMKNVEDDDEEKNGKELYVAFQYIVNCRIAL